MKPGFLTKRVAFSFKIPYRSLKVITIDHGAGKRVVREKKNHNGFFFQFALQHFYQIERKEEEKAFSDVDRISPSISSFWSLDDRSATTFIPGEEGAATSNFSLLRPALPPFL